MKRPADASDEHSDSTATSRSLLANARQADPVAWERLVGLYAPLVAFWCRRWGVAEQDLADLLQDVFSAVSAHLYRFHRDRPSDTFRGWLSAIARNKVNDHFRRRNREPDVTGGSDFSRQLQELPDANVPRDLSSVDERSLSDDDGMVWNELLRNALKTVRAEFHERTWHAFYGVVIGGRSAADVGHDLNMTTGAVRVAKSSVLLKLRRVLGDLAE